MKILVTTVVLDGKFHTLHFRLLYPGRPAHTGLLKSIVLSRQTRFKTGLGDSSGSHQGVVGLLEYKEDPTTPVQSPSV